jgi:hypothetical protein
VQVNGPAGSVPVQPAGNDTICTPGGDTKTTVIGPGSSDGPALSTLTNALSDVPGVMRFGILTEIERLEDGVPATARAAEVLFVVDGSNVDEVAAAVPPANVVPGTLFDGMVNGMLTVNMPVGPRGPGSVHESGPAGIGPVQPAGSEAIDTPDGGVYTTVVGPRTLERPAFSTVTTAFAVPPGVIIGVVTDVERSAIPAPTFIVDETTLLSGNGSVDPPWAFTDPPSKVTFGGTFDGTESCMSNDAEDPTAIGSSNEHDSGPNGNDPSHPAGSDTIIPIGGTT